MIDIHSDSRRYSGAALLVAAAVLLSLLIRPEGALHAYKPYLRSFMAVTPGAAGTRLADLPGRPGHCGLCHFDFNGGGTLNPYGQDFGLAVNSGESSKSAVGSIAEKDSDGDGFTNAVEIGGGDFPNGPTFPGLSAGNIDKVVNVDASLLMKHLTPAAGDGPAGESPLEIGIISPAGGEVIQAGGRFNVKFDLGDLARVSRMSVFFSGDAGATYDPVGVGLPPADEFSWFVADFPSSRSKLRVEAVDIAGAVVTAESGAVFTVKGRPAGRVPTTMRD
ncbi:MAG TPA: hypothetical protein VLA34_01965, partial [Candidatus Krumholzibacterium sp.]|nr:hypothetical protein [Candidatus Krumholzibacterium sp.]